MRGHIQTVLLKCFPFAQWQGSLPVHGLPRPLHWANTFFGYADPLAEKTVPSTGLALLPQALRRPQDSFERLPFRYLKHTSRLVRNLGNSDLAPRRHWFLEARVKKNGRSIRSPVFWFLLGFYPGFEIRTKALPLGEGFFNPGALYIQLSTWLLPLLGWQGPGPV